MRQQSSGKARHHWRCGQSRRTVSRLVRMVFPLAPGLNPARSEISVYVASLLTFFNSQRTSATNSARIDAMTDSRKRTETNRNAGDTAGLKMPELRLRAK